MMLLYFYFFFFRFIGPTMVETLNSACYNLIKQIATKCQYDFKNKQIQKSKFIVCYNIFIILYRNYSKTIIGTTAKNIIYTFFNFSQHNITHFAYLIIYYITFICICNLSYLLCYTQVLYYLCLLL